MESWNLRLENSELVPFPPCQIRPASVVPKDAYPIHPLQMDLSFSCLTYALDLTSVPKKKSLPKNFCSEEARAGCRDFEMTEMRSPKLKDTRERFP